MRLAHALLLGTTLGTVPVMHDAVPAADDTASPYRSWRLRGHVVTRPTDPGSRVQGVITTGDPVDLLVTFTTQGPAVHDGQGSLHTFEGVDAFEAVLNVGALHLSSPHDAITSWQATEQHGTQQWELSAMPLTIRNDGQEQPAALRLAFPSLDAPGLAFGDVPDPQAWNDQTAAALQLEIDGSPVTVFIAFDAPCSDDDGDHLCLADELARGTDPHSADSDRDGYADNVEVHAWTDPNDPFDRPLTAGDTGMDALAITEVVSNPTHCPGMDSAYVSLHHRGSRPLLLDGLTLDDDQGPHTLSGGRVIEPGDDVVIARSMDVSRCYGVLPDALVALDVDTFIY